MGEEKDMRTIEIIFDNRFPEKEILRLKKAGIYRDHWFDGSIIGLIVKNSDASKAKKILR